MADIGRWGVVDPAADLLEMSSPYVYSLNNPINFVDLDGELPIFINGLVASDSERGNASYWNAQLIETVKNSGIANPGGELHFVDGDRGMVTTGRNSRLSKTDISNSGGMSAGARKKAGEATAKADFETILGKLERDPKSGKIIEKIQIYTHSRGSAFGEGYTESLMKLIGEYADQFEDPSNVVQYSLNLASHQSNSINAVEGVETFGISHTSDALSGNDIKGAVNIHSDVGNVKTSHGNGSFVKEVKAFLSAISSSDGDKAAAMEKFKKMLEEYGISFTYKEK